MDHKRLIEAALFMAPKPLNVKELAKITGIGSSGTLQKALEELEVEYATRGIQITLTEEGWDMQIDPGLLPAVAHLAPYTDLSEGCKRALALITANEPMQQSELIKIQGNKAYNYIRKLARMGLVNTEKKGRTKLLHLTQEFENYFGEQKNEIKKRLAEGFDAGEAK